MEKRVLFCQILQGAVCNYQTLISFGLFLEVIDLMNSIIIFLSQTTLLRRLTFLLRSQTMILTFLLFCTFRLSSEAVNLLNLKQSSDRLVIIAKRFLKLPNLHILIKRKSPSLPRNLALSDSWQIVNSVAKVNLLHICYSSLQGCCILHLIKQNCFLKTFLTTLILMN